MAAIVEVRDLVKVYAGRGRASAAVRAVDGVSFEVAEGEFFGFLGPNGAGKSTTIKIITTLLKPTSGFVRVDGCSLEQESLAIRRAIGYAGQSIGVDGELTGRENLTLIGHLYHLPPALLRNRVEELLDVLQLTDVADRRAYTYSGGMRRRLDLGAGLVHRPRVLFLDEPTTGLDPQTRNAVWRHLRRLHQQEGMTIFLTTQYMEEADQLCERLAIIDHGRVVTQGSPAALKSAIGADVVTVRLMHDESFEIIRDRALVAVQRISGVSKATMLDDGVGVHAENGGAVLLAILRAFDDEQIAVREVALARPSLDEVFLQHTGHQMRPEEAKPPARMPMGGMRRR